MSFWINVDVSEKGHVKVTTYTVNAAGSPFNPIRTRTGATISQALRNLASVMVYAKAEEAGNKSGGAE